MRLFTFVLGLAGGATAVPAAAQTPSAPVTETQASYRCGGIGSDESIRMRGEMKDHALSLLFARPSGDYLADVRVNLSDVGPGGSTLLDWTASGPICLIDVPPGRYKVTARSGDIVRTSEVTIGQAPKRLDFRF